MNTTFRLLVSALTLGISSLAFAATRTDQPASATESATADCGCCEITATTTAQEISGQPWKAYFGESKDASEVMREAIRLGHIIPGMDRGQVTTALGEPIRKIHSTKTSGLEHWLYGIENLHQEQFRGRGWSFVRITFLDGRVIMVDPR